MLPAGPRRLSPLPGVGHPPAASTGCIPSIEHGNAMGGWQCHAWLRGRAGVASAGPTSPACTDTGTTAQWHPLHDSVFPCLVAFDLAVARETKSCSLGSICILISNYQQCCSGPAVARRVPAAAGGCPCRGRVGVVALHLPLAGWPWQVTRVALVWVLVRCPGLGCCSEPPEPLIPAAGDALTLTFSPHQQESRGFSTGGPHQARVTC